MLLAAAASLTLVTAGASGAAAQQQSAEPPLKIVAGSTEVTLDRFPDYGVDLDLGTHLVAGKSAISPSA
ncbi:hypothetical protein [Kribbella endophytica]